MATPQTTGGAYPSSLGLSPSKTTVFERQKERKPMYILISNRPGGEHYCGRGCHCLQSSWGNASNFELCSNAEEVAKQIASFEADNRDSGECHHIVITKDHFDPEETDKYLPCDLESDSIPEEIEELLLDAREKAYLLADKKKEELEKQKRIKEAKARKEAQEKMEKEQYEKLKAKFGD
jgi:hypothetical protein